MTRRALPLILAVLGVAAACSGGGGAGVDLSRQAGEPTTTTTATTAPPPPTTIAPPPPTSLPAAPASGDVRAVVTSTGVVAPVLRSSGPGAFVVRTPCGREAGVAGVTPLYGATVVLDPGHGGSESGAVGANGLTEKELNLAVALRTKDVLEAAGATVVLTRTTDIRMVLGTRAEIALALRPSAFVSIHHNGGHDGPSDKPGTETFFQVASAESRRLAGILYEELLGTFSRYEGITWHADLDAGAKYRLNGSGGDYYGILRRSAGVPTVLSEALFLSSSPAEAELLARPDVQQAEAEAIARAVGRFLTTTDPGSGFVEPYPREEPAGPGGGASGCEDPPLS